MSAETIMDALTGEDRHTVRSAAHPTWLTPMLATLTEDRFSDPDIARRSDVAVFYYVLDLLHWNGLDLRRLPRHARKSLLRRAIRFDDPLRLSWLRIKDGKAFHQEACEKGWEGLIAKRADAPYHSGRSRDWVKFKCSRAQEMVIGGFTELQVDPAGDSRICETGAVTGLAAHRWQDSPAHSGVVVIDGGLSNALEDRGHNLSDTLWTARLLRDAPEEIAAVHRSYFTAGARVATAASYQADIAGFVASGLEPREARRLVASSVMIARDVRDSLAFDGTRRWVAASVGPYGATRADGSEYRGRYDLSPAALRDFHLPRLEILAEAGPDLLAVETIPDIEEAEVLVGLLDDLGLPAWFSFSARGTTTCAGQPLSAAFEVAASTDCVGAVGVNCCSPADVLPALDLARTVTGKRGVAYPNSGERWDAEARAWTGTSTYDVQLATRWAQAGAAYVGGCCRVGPQTIAALASVLESA